MAEIHVRTKKQSTSNTVWIWILVALLIVAAVTYFAVKNKDTAPDNTTPPVNPTSQVQQFSDMTELWMA